MKFTPVRIYDHEQPSGYRLLIDRLWPRGISKAVANLDLWDKTIAPSTELREWFGHDPAKWAEFETRYIAELDANQAAVADLIATVKSANPTEVLLLFGAKDEAHNNAMVLSEYLPKQWDK